MTAQLLDGKALATKIRHQIAASIAIREEKHFRPPGLAVVLVGDNAASEIYVRNKRRACEEVGIKSFFHPLPADTTEQQLIELIHQLNADPNIDGILLQLPLPETLDSNKILETILPEKDVDGFHPYNLGRLTQRRPLLRPCTPLGIMLLLDSIQVPYKQKHAVIVGASNIVGRPMALELLLAGSTVTICHRFTENLSEQVKEADLLVSAAGKPGIIKGEWIKPGAIVVDVGITRLPDGTITGDIEFDKARERASWITPVPGGVGPMTVAALLKNTLLAAENFSEKKS